MTAHDQAAADQLDRDLDRLVRGDGQPAAGSDPRLAAVRALRAHEEAPAPDPTFVARLRETLLMDATLPIPGPVPGEAANGAAPTRGTSLPPLPLAAPDARYRDARRDLTASSVPAITPTRIDTRRHTLVQRWNQLGWPVVELLGVAALILGLVSVMMGGNGGLPALVPGFGQTTHQATPAADTGEVAMAQGNAGRTGEMPGPGVTDSPEVAWSKTLSSNDGGTFTSAPIASNGTTYVFSQSSVSSQVNAYDLATGSLRWQYGISGARLEGGAPAIADGLLFVPATDFGPDEQDVLFGTPGVEPEPYAPTGRLVAVDTDTGQERWTYETGGIGYLAPLVMGDLVYVTDGMGAVEAVSIATGQLVWEASVPVEGDTVSGIVIPNASLSGGEGVVYLAANTGTLHAFDAITGDERWATMLAGDSPTTPVLSDGTLYLTSSEQVVTTDPGYMATLVVDEPEPIQAGTGRLFAVVADTGEIRWTRDLATAPQAAVAVAGDQVMLAGLGADANMVQAVDAATGAGDLWSVELGGQIIAPLVLAGGIGYVGTFGTDFAAIDLSTGNVLWSVAAIDIGYSAAFVSDGYVVFATGGQRSTLYAIQRADVATPAANQRSPVDISGLPPCDVEPRPDVAATPVPDTTNVVPTVARPNATPELTLPDIDVGTETQQPVIAWNEIPVGTPAPRDAVESISAALGQMQVCDRPGNGRYVAAFYSDDYFLRPWVVWYVAFNGYQFWHAVEGDIDAATIADQARLLPDGRVAVLRTIDKNPDYGQLFIFADQDGQWLIDEFEEVTPNGVFHGG